MRQNVVGVRARIVLPLLVEGFTKLEEFQAVKKTR
jgi:hypothetical protein